MGSPLINNGSGDLAHFTEINWLNSKTFHPDKLLGTTKINMGLGAHEFVS